MFLLDPGGSGAVFQQLPPGVSVQGDRDVSVEIIDKAKYTRLAKAQKTAAEIDADRRELEAARNALAKAEHDEKRAEAVAAKKVEEDDD